MLQSVNENFDQKLAKKEQEHAKAMEEMQKAHDAEIKRHEDIEAEL